jgi:hypothetical protein
MLEKNNMLWFPVVNFLVAIFPDKDTSKTALSISPGTKTNFYFFNFQIPL